MGNKITQDIIFVKRTNNNRLRTFNLPVIKLELKGSRFIISDILAKKLNVDHNDGLMFGFNKKAKSAYVIKDDEDDAFKLSRKDPYTLRFSSKDLMNYFVDTFGLLETGKSTFIFNVDLINNERRLYRISLADKNK